MTIQLDSKIMRVVSRDRRPHDIATEVERPSKKLPSPYFSTELGVLYQGDCLEVLPKIGSDTMDVIFADPPFNLKKQYGANTNDNLDENEYVK